MFTVLCQSSTIMSELMRLSRNDIHLEAETPYISVYDTELKTKDRARIVPLPFRTERLSELLALMDEGQTTALPPTVVKATETGFEWVCSESNVNRQLNDYIKMCEGFGVKARRVSKREDLREAMREMLDADEPYLLEVIVPYTEHVLPMIPQGKSAKEILID